MPDAHDERTDHAEPILGIEGLTVTFPADPGRRVRAVEGVGLEIYPGRTTAVVGESGSGKSVTALSILRLLAAPPARYESGRVGFTCRDGERVDLLTIPDRRLRGIRGDEIAMIFQEPMTSLNPVLTIGDQIIEAVRLHRDVTRRQAVAISVGALAEVGIPDPESRLRAYPHEFSGGMRQRAMIAIALSCEPRILIADEPTTALDVTIQAQILDLLDGLKRDRRLGVLLISHDIGLVSNRADSVVVMYAGRVVESGPIEAVIGHAGHPYTRGLLAASPGLTDQRTRLRTLDAFTADPERMLVECGGQKRRAWWPNAKQASCVGAETQDVFHRIGNNHHVRVWNQ